MRRFLYNLHKQNLYYFLWYLSYKFVKEIYWIHRCQPADRAMHRRFALYGYASNPYAFKLVYNNWKDD